MTLAETLAEARAILIAAGSKEPEAAIDVDLYAREILGWDRAQLLSRLREDTPPALEPTFSDWLARRARREPTAYIIGYREFWGLEFRTTQDVLVPRPESELVVEEGLALLSGVDAPRLADIGTGSGCLAIALAHDVPAARVVATDVSEGALRIARDNATRLGVADRVRFVRTSYLQGVTGQFDLIVSNPPYVREGDRPALARPVRHEPEVALFGGTDGLRDIVGVLNAAAETLRPGGHLLMEFGYGQEDDVRRLASITGLYVERIRLDLQDIPRTAIISRP